MEEQPSTSSVTMKRTEDTSLITYYFKQAKKRPCHDFPGMLFLDDSHDLTTSNLIKHPDLLCNTHNCGSSSSNQFMSQLTVDTNCDSNGSMQASIFNKNKSYKSNSSLLGKRKARKLIQIPEQGFSPVSQDGSYSEAEEQCNKTTIDLMFHNEDSNFSFRQFE